MSDVKVLHLSVRACSILEELVRPFLEDGIDFSSAVPINLEVDSITEESIHEILGLDPSEPTYPVKCIAQFETALIKLLNDFKIPAEVGEKCVTCENVVEMTKQGSNYEYEINGNDYIKLVNLMNEHKKTMGDINEPVSRNYNLALTPTRKIVLDTILERLKPRTESVAPIRKVLISKYEQVVITSMIDKCIYDHADCNDLNAVNDLLRGTIQKSTKVPKFSVDLEMIIKK